MTQVTFEISDDVAEKAKSYGLLDSETVEELLLRKVRSCAAAKFCEAAEDLHKSEPPITEDELVELCRAARRKE